MFRPLRLLAAGVFAAVQLTAAIACSASKGAGDGSPTSPSVPQTATIRASDVLLGTAIQGATVAGSGVTGGTTDSGGSLTLTTMLPSTFGIDITSASYIPRNTLLKVPGNDAAVSLISNTLNLTAFNEMVRNSASNDTLVDGGLQRWTSQPSLRIVSNVVQFTATGTTLTATNEALTPAEIQSITSDLSYGLPLLTGGVFQTFAGISTQSVSAGEGVTMLAEGRITFARCSGLTAARGSAGYGQWLFRSDDVVTGGMLCVDSGFELEHTGSTVLHAVRLHELGHALGYHHVLKDVLDHVLMNPTISVDDITQWDRDVARIAFQRPTGNRTPDRDPSVFTVNKLTTRVMTTDACRVSR